MMQAQRRSAPQLHLRDLVPERELGVEAEQHLRARDQAGAVLPEFAGIGIEAQQALSALVAARAPVARAMADLDALAATRVTASGGILPGDLAAIQAAGSEAGAISQRHAELIDRLQARLASN